MQAKSRSDDTKRLLCIAAEAMFASGARGDVTLRSVATAAGQRNTGAVAYHFGDKQGSSGRSSTYVSSISTQSAGA